MLPDFQDIHQQDAAEKQQGNGAKQHVTNIVFTIFVAMGQRVVRDKSSNSEKNPIKQAMVPIIDMLQSDKFWRNVLWDWPDAPLCGRK